ncbi:signal peptidase II [Paenibacillus mesophilus]|uniref:signal peptidase II n=1 Tax=Paenibacillus mesophilus TaxID=2582849 RepID=UPI00110E5F48|nr:signal peptidase II [Paenibacillus mesophilus]TMV46641.1 signal peptidase II [Paenibacillus mesophilus]
MIYYVYSLIVFILDQVTKRLIVVNMEEYESRSIIGEFFQLTSHRNRGAAFGILQDQRWFFIAVTSVIVVGIIWYIQKLRKDRSKTLLKVALSLLLGGACGNFLDRALFGEVVDFLHFRFVFSIFGWDVDYDFAIFNLADSAIVIGVSLIFLDSLLTWRKERRGLTHEQDHA